MEPLFQSMASSISVAIDLIIPSFGLSKKTPDPDRSESIPLKAGDVIFSGTPAGVGKLKKDDSVLATLHQPNASSLNFKIS